MSNIQSFEDLAKARSFVNLDGNLPFSYYALETMSAVASLLHAEDQESLNEDLANMVESLAATRLALSPANSAKTLDPIDLPVNEFVKAVMSSPHEVAAGAQLLAWANDIDALLGADPLNETDILWHLGAYCAMAAVYIVFSKNLDLPDMEELLKLQIAKFEAETQ